MNENDMRDEKSKTRYGLIRRQKKEVQEETNVGRLRFVLKEETKKTEVPVKRCELIRRLEGI